VNSIFPILGSLPPLFVNFYLCLKENFSFIAHNNNLGKEGAIKIGEIASKIVSVEKLHLADNGFLDQGMTSLLEGLSNNSSVSWLDVSNNLQCSEKQIPQIYKDFKLLLNSICPLEVLHLRGGTAGKLRDINQLLYCVGTNTTLTEIDISGHEFGDRGAIALARVLQQNNTLVSVYLDNNNVERLGLLNLADAVTKAKSLREMPIPFADVARAMFQMPTLKDKIEFGNVLAKLERELSSRRFRDNAGL